MIFGSWTYDMDHVNPMPMNWGGKDYTLKIGKDSDWNYFYGENRVNYNQFFDFGRDWTIKNISNFLIILKNYSLTFNISTIPVMKKSTMLIPAKNTLVWIWTYFSNKRWYTNMVQPNSIRIILLQWNKNQTNNIFLKTDTTNFSNE